MELFDYRYFTQNIPFFILLCYVLFRNKKIDVYFKMCIYIIMIFVPVFVSLYLFGFNMFGFLHSYWGLEAPIEYAISIIVMYYYSMKRSGDISYSVTLSYLMVSMSGYIYEMPRFFKLQGLVGLVRYSKYGLFYYDFQIISIMFVWLMLIIKGFNANKKIFAAFLIYILYLITQIFTGIYVAEYDVTITWLDYISFYYIGNWLYRIPSLLLCFSLISGIKEK